MIRVSARRTAWIGGILGFLLLWPGMHALAQVDVLFVGGAVVTLDAKDRVAEALAVRDGRIVAVGSEAPLRALSDAATQIVDLEGAALLPGFVDSHSHANFIGLQAMSANLLPPPDGGGDSVAALQQALRDYMATEPRLQNEIGWVVGFGYDDSQLAEERHPTRQDLDAVSSEIPILIIHQSGHLGVANSKGLQMAGITADTADPPGGAFRREEGGAPNGVAEEYAFFALIFAALSGVTDQLADDMLVAGTQLMASYGYTTAQEGRASPDSMAAMQRAADAGSLAIDLVSYPDILMVQDPTPRRSYRNRYRTGGVKLTIDGSPQGKTAWLSRPYHVPPMGQGEDYAGYPAIDAQTINSSVARAMDAGWQILVHANGDAAIDALIAAVDAAHADPAIAAADLRPVLIHGQTLREDQVDELQRLKIFPSLFPMHTFYWGDWHYDSVLGPERAENISPTGWLRERGMIFGSHHDAPVALPDSMRVLSATVTRKTRSGRILGAQQRVDVATGLRALTIWPAWQHFEEERKGSLETGKLADLVILSANPLETEADSLVDIEVLATFKEGQTVYDARNDGADAR